MLRDNFGRKIDYLRISVTDKCNYRCVYCMPEEGVKLKRHEEILSFEKITRIAGCAARLGIVKIRLTGGEPLVRKDVEKLVAMLAHCEGIDELVMTSNGSLLSEEKALDLKRAGLSRINISLDTLDGDEFKKITRRGNIEDVLSGIEAARSAGLDPVKINMVIFEDTSHDDIKAMRSFCQRKGLKLQTIKQFSLYNREGKISFPFVFDRPQPCSLCNKIRLTADGLLKPCLLSNSEIRVDWNDIEKSLKRAVREKPQRGTVCDNRMMSQIGG
ncbi:MAG: radical SAM protein [Candidatus Krumholzibacteriota bacterium]|nr:radical SAM protein [Candidatus Krumholzibacteriota bacterium]